MELREGAEGEMVGYINIWAIITEAAAFRFAIATWVLVLTALGRSNTVAKCRLFHDFSTVTGEVRVSDWHPTCTPHRLSESRTAEHLRSPPRSEEALCGLRNSLPPVPNFQTGSHFKGFLLSKGGDPNYLDNLNALHCVRKRVEDHLKPHSKYMQLLNTYEKN